MNETGALSRFELSKWYADCVGEHGDVLITYHEVVQWP